MDNRVMLALGAGLTTAGELIVIDLDALPHRYSDFDVPCKPAQAEAGSDDDMPGRGSPLQRRIDKRAQQQWQNNHKLKMRGR